MFDLLLIQHGLLMNEFVDRIYLNSTKFLTIGLQPLFDIESLVNKYFGLNFAPTSTSKMDQLKKINLNLTKFPVISFQLELEDLT